MNKNLFSFLRGRLRTKKEKRKKGEEANEVFVSFFGKQTRNMGLRRFPDFEVGFGRSSPEIKSQRVKGVFIPSR